ncbi:MAG: coproporphyrinogen dehydrogenase HemZ [Candidatus Limivivens sp.]|nr:coproporphyrinogen dehydrogenase HemZ [Candidatus Limivivens sp.]
MIALQLNKRDFEYDAHSLVRAFYPGTDVSIFYGEEEIREPWDLKIRLDYQEQFIEITFYSGAGEILASGRSDVDYYADRKETKNHLKYRLYQMLSEYTGQKLPWGTLTGIRPTKIPMAFLEQGKKPAWIAEYMRNTYLISPEKTALGISIAVREKDLLERIPYEKGYSLYIGIPFCPSICLYCSFSSSPLALWEDKVDRYLDALCREIAYGAEEYAGRTLNTVYIGGGTPTTLSPAQMDRLLSQVEQHFDLSRVQEFTVEAGRPDSITEEKLAVLKRHPVTRISINPQTMNQETLDLIGRRHTVEQTREAFRLARRMGFDNINMDLIVGLPGEEKPRVEATMVQIAELNPDSLTVHSLAVKRAARLNMFKDQYKELTFVNSCEIMDMTAEYARNLGMFPYYLYRQKNMAGNFENVGYARPGKEGLYNILIMEEKQSILALGAGASTKVVAGERIDRIENVKDIKSYIERIDEMIERKRQGFLKYGK